MLSIFPRTPTTQVHGALSRSDILSKLEDMDKAKDKANKLRENCTLLRIVKFKGRAHTKNTALRNKTYVLFK